ncbi:ATP-binding protein [Streptomyces sp. NPDC052301]|uniref:ATP-binding protein n=1 Tax=Streptomyces sp. NPDC052301 TaxID=3365687 RepID=UPI0037D8F9E9
MVTPLKDRASDEQEPAASLRYSAAWEDTADVSIAKARAAVRTLLVQAGHASHHRSSQDAQLVVSELVTNAVRHAPGPGALVLELTPDTTLLRIIVSDSSPDLPVPRAHDAHRVGGHGLHLVSRLCDQLHTTALDSGKQIAAHLHLKPAR